MINKLLSFLPELLCDDLLETLSAILLLNKSPVVSAAF